MPSLGKRQLIWTLLAVPAAMILIRFSADSISYGQAVIQTGLWSAALLLTALFVTPLQRVLGSRAWVRFLRRHRRDLGVASFGYAALHTAIYLERKWGAGLVLTEAQDPALAAGWLALLVFLVLAVTSNDASVRALGRRWKQLHRSVYAAAGLTFAHWILATVSPLAALVCLCVFLLAETARLVADRAGRSGN